MAEIEFITAAGQVALPLALVVWLWRGICRGRGEWLLRAVCVAAYLALIAVASPWLLLPWYLPWGFAGLGLAAAAASWRRCGRSSAPYAERRLKAGFRLGCQMLLAAFCAGMLAWALSGHTPPADLPPVDLASPFNNGRFFVVNGGYSILVNPHMKALKGESLAAYRAQSYALDIVRLDGFGRRAQGLWPRESERYYIFDQPVHAPCSGVVARTESRLPDLTPPSLDREHPAGNFVLLRCPEADILLAHLKRSSLTVNPGDRVEEGQVIGRVGNSGMSLEPHLHLHTQRPGAEDDFLSAEPLALTIGGRTLVRNSRFTHSK